MKRFVSPEALLAHAADQLCLIAAPVRLSPWIGWKVSPPSRSPVVRSPFSAFQHVPDGTDELELVAHFAPVAQDNYGSLLAHSLSRQSCIAIGHHFVFAQIQQ